MAGAKKGSKNNIANRGSSARIKRYAGQDVVPVQVINRGKKFMAAQYKASGQLIIDASGNYVAYSSVQ